MWCISTFCTFRKHVFAWCPGNHIRNIFQHNSDISSRTRVWGGGDMVARKSRFLRIDKGKKNGREPRNEELWNDNKNVVDTLDFRSNWTCYRVKRQEIRRTRIIPAFELNVFPSLLIAAPLPFASCPGTGSYLFPSICPTSTVLSSAPGWLNILPLSARFSPSPSSPSSSSESWPERNNSRSWSSLDRGKGVRASASRMAVTFSDEWGAGSVRMASASCNSWRQVKPNSIRRLDYQWEGRPLSYSPRESRHSYNQRWA